MAAAIAVPLVVAFIGSLIVGGIETSGEQKELQRQIGETEEDYAQSTAALDQQIEQTSTVDLPNAEEALSSAQDQLAYDLDTLRLQKAMDVGANRASAAARGLGGGGTAKVVEDYLKKLADRGIQQRKDAGESQIEGLTNTRDYLQSLMDPGGYYEQQRTLLENDYNTDIDYLTEQTSSGAQLLSFAGNTLGNFLPFLGAVL